MKTVHHIADKILVKIKRRRVSAPVSAIDFLDLGSRPAVDQGLSRLVRRGLLCRIGRGMYALPKVSSLTGGQAVVSPHDVARTIARKLGLRILPSRQYASNLLGLSTQVPAKLIFFTDGRSRSVKAGAFTLHFRHASPRTMAVSGRVAPLVFQALRDLRHNGVSDSHIAHLRRLLKQRDKKELLDNLRHAPGWMRPVLLQVAEATPEEEHGSSS